MIELNISNHNSFQCSVDRFTCVIIWIKKNFNESISLQTEDERHSLYAAEFHTFNHFSDVRKYKTIILPSQHDNLIIIKPINDY